MIEVLLACLFMGMIVAMIMTVWFDTDAFVEYASILCPNHWFWLDAYQEMSGDDVQMTYPKFLVMHHNSFLTRLISCPKCLCVWLSLIVNSFGIASLGVCMSCLSTLATAYISLFLYLQLVKLLNNE